MKKVLSCVLILAALLALVQPALVAGASGIEPLFDQAQQAEISMYISSTGKANIVLTGVGKLAVTKINAITYLEKKVGGSWQRVNIGTYSNVWEYQVNDNVLSKGYDWQLSTRGEYRAVVRFAFYGSKVEYITDTVTKTY